MRKLTFSETCDKPPSFRDRLSIDHPVNMRWMPVIIMKPTSAFFVVSASAPVSSTLPESFEFLWSFYYQRILSFLDYEFDVLLHQECYWSDERWFCETRGEISRREARFWIRIRQLTSFVYCRCRIEMRRRSIIYAEPPSTNTMSRQRMKRL